MATTKKPAVQTPDKTVDFNTLNLDELTAKVEQLRDETIELKRGTKMGDVQNVHAYLFKRRELARALTARNAKMAEGDK